MASSTLDKAGLRRAILRWYNSNRRDLPWRRTRDPYAIWVAEIMLQQTRVAAVLEHYRDFLRRFPTVRALANASPAAVLASWSGLGYYRRARALHQAAKVIVRDHKGRLPATEPGLRRLPGVGRYTAAAVASTAFGQACAVVDGNVERVLTRLLGQRITGKLLWDAAGQLLSRRRPGDFNQAIMELGATVCLPTAPRCDACPLRSWCVTRGRSGAGQQHPRRKQRVGYCLFAANGRVLLVQRDSKASLMPGMWELPAAPADNQSGTSTMVLRHSITDTDYIVTVALNADVADVNGRWISRSRLRQLPLTGLARKILRRAGII